MEPIKPNSSAATTITPPTVDVWPTLSPLKAVCLTINLTFAMTLNILSLQSITIALPSIGSDLNITTMNLQWPISAYSLALGCSLLLAGRVSDLYGHKRVFVCGTAWFAIWSIACGFAKNEISLDLMRGFQGLGAAASIPSAMGVIAQTFAPGPSRSTAFASFSAGAAFGGSLGNVFGGLLTTYATWRTIFYVTAGLAGAVCLIGYFLISSDIRPDHSEDTSVDWLGAAMITTGLVIFTYVLAGGEGAPKGWATPYIPVLLVLSVFLIGGFGFWEYHLEHRAARAPLVRLSMFTKGRFAAIQVLAGFGWACFASQQFFATLYYQDYLKLNPISTSVRFLPMAVTGLALNFLVAVVAARVPAQLLLVLGSLGSLLAPLLFALLPRAGTSYWHQEFPAMILTVFGADLVFSVGIMLCSKVASKDEQALAGGIFNTITQIGAAVGLAVTNIVKDRVTSSSMSKLGLNTDPASDHIDPRAFLDGLRASFFGCFAFGVISLMVALVFLRGAGTAGVKKTTLPQADSIEKSGFEKDCPSVAIPMPAQVIRTV